MRRGGTLLVIGVAALGGLTTLAARRALADPLAPVRPYARTTIDRYMKRISHGNGFDLRRKQFLGGITARQAGARLEVHLRPLGFVDDPTLPGALFSRELAGGESETVEVIEEGGTVAIVHTKRAAAWQIFVARLQPGGKDPIEDEALGRQR